MPSRGCGMVPASRAMSDAKRALRKAVQAWCGGRGEAPQILRACDACGEERWFALDRRVTGLELDAHLPHGRRADAVLRDAAGRARLVVRLADGSRLAHRATVADGAPLIELSGAALVAEPLRWRPLRDSDLPRWRCRCALARPLPVDDAFSLRVIGCPLGLRREESANASAPAFASVVHDCARCHFFVGIGYADAERRRVSLYCSFGATARRRVGPAPAPRLPVVEDVPAAVAVADRSLA
jgi:hypothetical protein